MYALCVSGAVNTQGFALYINFHSFIHSYNLCAQCQRTVVQAACEGKTGHLLIIFCHQSHQLSRTELSFKRLKIK